MAYNTRSIKKDVDGRPIPQYFNQMTDNYEPLLGEDGAARSILWGPNGQPLSVIDNKLAVRATDLETLIGALNDSAVTNPANAASVIAALKGLLSVVGTETTLGGVKTAVDVLAGTVDTQAGVQKVALSGRTAADGLALVNGGSTVAQNLLYNGQTLDLARGNTSVVALALAARTGFTQSPILTNHNARGVIITWRITEVGNGQMWLQVRLVDPASGSTEHAISFERMSAANVTPPVNLRYIVYPGAQQPQPSGTESFSWPTRVISAPIPRRWTVSIAAQTVTEPWTYSVSVDYIL